MLRRDYVANEQSGRSNKKSKTISFTHHNPRIVEIRRQKKIRKARIFIAIIIAAIVLFCYLLGLFNSPLATAGEYIDTLSYYFMEGQEMPVNLPLTGVQTAQKLVGSFAVLGERELIFYSDNGSVIRRVPHGYVLPVISSSDTRICIYTRGNTKLSVEGRDRTLFTYTFDAPIMYTQMSENGTLAVFTQNSLEVFDELYQSVWKWDDINEIPLSIAFKNDNASFAVAIVSAIDGALGSEILFYNINSGEAKASTGTNEAIPIKMQYIGSNLLVVYDSFVAIYRASTGEELLRYDYNEKLLQSVDISETGTCALLFGENDYPGITQFVTLDDDLNEIANIIVGEAAQDINIVNNDIYLFVDNNVLQYDFQGELISTIKADNTPIKIIETDDILLLTEEKIDYLYKNEQTTHDVQ